MRRAVDGHVEGAQHRGREDARLPVAQVGVALEERGEDGAPHVLHPPHRRGRHAIPHLWRAGDEVVGDDRAKDEDAQDWSYGEEGRIAREERIAREKVREILDIYLSKPSVSKSYKHQEIFLVGIQRHCHHVIRFIKDS